MSIEKELNPTTQYLNPTLKDLKPLFGFIIIEKSRFTGFWKIYMLLLRKL